MDDHIYIYIYTSSVLQRQFSKMPSDIKVKFLHAEKIWCINIQRQRNLYKDQRDMSTIRRWSMYSSSGNSDASDKPCSTTLLTHKMNNA